jgi:hypothetical protein
VAHFLSAPETDSCISQRESDVYAGQERLSARLAAYMAFDFPLGTANELLPAKVLREMTQRLIAHKAAG